MSDGFVPGAILGFIAGSFCIGVVSQIRIDRDRNAAIASGAAHYVITDTNTGKAEFQWAKPQRIIEYVTVPSFTQPAPMPMYPPTIPSFPLPTNIVYGFTNRWPQAWTNSGQYTNGTAITRLNARTNDMMVLVSTNFDAGWIRVPTNWLTPEGLRAMGGAK